ncbi:hypothetical protein H5410_033684 [Solanum commersonii]|uniref:Uncharacterized protein n=1 Tax=Solanum commersonii TaxID=4109 RepID=A0A9J5YPB7_SOLCO|nr:hypothetical protein H5410_033684 [Solanum commersonii]
MGSVNKLLKEKGMNGCLSNIYQSVGNLDDTYLKSKDIILKPIFPLEIVESIPYFLVNFCSSIATSNC